MQEEWLSPLTLFVSSLLVTALGFTTTLLMEGGFGLETSSTGLCFHYNLNSGGGRESRTLLLIIDQSFTVVDLCA